MKSIVLLTATYNHPEELKSLYNSLCAQKNKDFSWMIVNDGSKAETETVLQEFAQEDCLDITVIYQPNQGKSAAINNGLNNLSSDVEFVAIIDDDERLSPEAVDTLRRYCDKYRDTTCGVIHFNRKNEKGEIIASPIVDSDYYMSYQEFKSKGRYADGYLSYYTKKLNDCRFNIIQGEKYIAPSTLFMKVTRSSNLLWACVSLGETEYLAGGITKQGRRLRIKNPQGMIEYCELMQENGASLKTRVLYSIQGYAYIFIYGKPYSPKKLLKIGAIPGKVLSVYWKNKYC